MATPKPATADSGYITEPNPLENTYTSDPSLQRTLECEFAVSQLFKLFLIGLEGISRRLLCNLYNHILPSSGPRLSQSGSVIGAAMLNAMFHT